MDGMRFARTVWSYLSETYAAWSEHNAPRLGAALAYYTVFSIAPLLVIVIAIAGLVFGADAARGQVMAQIEDSSGRKAHVPSRTFSRTPGRRPRERSRRSSAS